MMRTVAVIPARLGSTRLPDKLLLCETGKPLVIHTAENAALANTVDQVVVATDSEEIARACKYHGVEVVCFASDAWCGTARVAEAVRHGYVDGDIILNVQADEPCVCGSTLDELVTFVPRIEQDAVATVSAPFSTVSELSDENVTKADADYSGKCHCFGRSGWFVRPCHHVGVYGFRRKTLLAVGSLPQSESSRRWSLEQVTWLDAEYLVRTIFVQTAPLSINTEEDYRQFVEMQAAGATAGTAV